MSVGICQSPNFGFFRSGQFSRSKPCLPWSPPSGTKAAEQTRLFFFEGIGAGVYDQAGVLRDMYQSHLLPWLNLTPRVPTFAGNPARRQGVVL